MNMPGKPLSELPVNAYSIRRTEPEIDAVLGKADVLIGPSQLSEYTYARGVLDALSWLLGMSEQEPLSGGG
jgi:hypothetical protein